MKRKIEILAPAGSFECLVAALKSGADAVYVGGTRFGARAFANNFNEEELKRAIDLVHLHGKQLYLTVNTLLKESEMDELHAYLLPLYLHGLDAVIVQDLGVLQFVKKNFPDLQIHASTQMTITNLLGAKYLETLGVSRVVTARELSVSEVQSIASGTNLEVESFVHGALCYCYSGQCLYSSMIGGRSGNRGQCAQPCRLPYKVDNVSSYVMSLKDICTLDDIPQLVESGVYSFKIEGRMKKPEYVASVTAMYRKYVDLYLENGSKNYRVLLEDIDKLRDIFNRGDFHNGYWNQKNGRDMITDKKPSHTGVAAVRILFQKGRIITGEVLRELKRGDILDISEGGDNYTLGTDYQKKAKIELSLRKGVKLESDTVLYRTRNQSLINEIQASLDNNKLQEKIQGVLTLFEGEPLGIHLTHKEVTISVIGDVVLKAENLPMTEEKIRKQMNKTGGTPFVFEQLDVYMDPHIFIPVQQLNQLRRDALEQLQLAIVDSYRRKRDGAFIAMAENDRLLADRVELDKKEFIVYGESIEQINCVLSHNYVSKIYVDCNVVSGAWNHPALVELVNRIHKSKKKAYFVMPHIFRKETIKRYEKNWSQVLRYGFDGMVVRNLENMQFLKEQGYHNEIMVDQHVYVYNNEANAFWDNQGVARKTNALELTAKELKQINQNTMDLVIYGYTPMMISAQCVKKTTRGCDKNSGNLKMTDRINKEFIIKNNCDYCYNVVYNNCPTSIIDEVVEIRNINPCGLRINFTIEDSQITQDVLDVIYRTYFLGETCNINTESTKGHFRRGIG